MGLLVGPNGTALLLLFLSRSNLFVLVVYVSLSLCSK